MSPWTFHLRNETAGVQITNEYATKSHNVISSEAQGFPRRYTLCVDLFYNHEVYENLEQLVNPDLNRNIGSLSVVLTNANNDFTSTIKFANAILVSVVTNFDNEALVLETLWIYNNSFNEIATTRQPKSPPQKLDWKIVGF